MTRIVYTASALQDLDDIWDYIAIENHAPDAADRLIDQFQQKLEPLKAHPELGEAVPHLRPNTRRLVHGRYLLFYEKSEATIRLLRVIDGARLISEDDFGE